MSSITQRAAAGAAAAGVELRVGAAITRTAATAATVIQALPNALELRLIDHLGR
jgi:hypothetical protein